LLSAAGERHLLFFDQSIKVAVKPEWALLVRTQVHARIITQGELIVL
jgi:hypothetical protein